MDSPTVEAVAQVAGDLIAAIGLYAVWYQVRDHKTERSDNRQQEIEAFTADHDRRKKQATIEYVNRVRNEWRTARQALRKELGAGPITEAKLAKVRETPDLEDLLRGLLASLEDFSAGANIEVFDADLVNAMCGSFLIGVHDDCELFIKHAQKTITSNYTEFETLVRYLREKRQLSPVPKIKQIGKGRRG